VAPGMLERLARTRRAHLGVSLAVLAALVALAKTAGLGAAPRGVTSFLVCLCAWAGILGFLGGAVSALNRRTVFLDYANEAVLPFYMLHQAVIVAVGYALLGWSSGFLLKYLALFLLSLLLTLGLYEGLVRRMWLPRLLFGLPWRRV